MLHAVDHVQLHTRGGGEFVGGSEHLHELAPVAYKLFGAWGDN